MPSPKSGFDWGGLAKVLGNAAAKVAVRAIDHARDSVLSDLDKMLDQGKARIAAERGPDRAQEPPKKVKVGVAVKKKAKKTARKARTTDPAPAPHAVQDAEFEPAEPKRPRE